jgi:hypothetical protein
MFDPGTRHHPLEQQSITPVSKPRCGPLGKGRMNIMVRRRGSNGSNTGYDGEHNFTFGTDARKTGRVVASWRS